MASQALKRISIRWLPEPAYEDTETIALNVGGYFVDLRVNKNDSTIQWSRAGERKTLKHDPPTFQWTHIIDSLDLTVPDKAYFEKLPNGDDLEIGTTPCPSKGGAPTSYEEVWRDVTSTIHGEPSWIFQSTDGMRFLGKVGDIYLAISKEPDGRFTARREDRLPSGNWRVSFESDAAHDLLQAIVVIEATEKQDPNLTEGGKVSILGQEYVVRGICRT